MDKIKALGLTIPPSLLGRADEVIQWCQELRWLRSSYADDTEDIWKEALGRFAEKWRARRGEETKPSL